MINFAFWKDSSDSLAENKLEGAEGIILTTVWGVGVSIWPAGCKPEDKQQEDTGRGLPAKRHPPEEPALPVILAVAVNTNQ